MQQLKSHVNTAKLDHANPLQWGSALVQDNVRLAWQLLEQSREIADLKEQLFQVSRSKQSPVPFLGAFLPAVWPAPRLRPFSSAFDVPSFLGFLLVLDGCEWLSARCRG